MCKFYAFSIGVLSKRTLSLRREAVFVFPRDSFNSMIALVEELHFLEN